MDYVDCYWGLYRDYFWDPFPHSLLSTRQTWQAFKSCLSDITDIVFLVLSMEWGKGSL